MPLRISDNYNARSIAIGADATGKLKVRAVLTGAGTTVPGTPYKLTFDDYGWTATTLSLSTGTSASPQRFYIGIAEGTMTSHTPTYPGPGLSTEMFEFVIGGPTILKSTVAAGTTGQGVNLTTGATVISGSGAVFSGTLGEFAVFRRYWDSTALAYSSAPTITTATLQFGNLSTGTQAILLTGLPMVLTS